MQDSTVWPGVRTLEAYPHREPAPSTGFLFPTAAITRIGSIGSRPVNSIMAKTDSTATTAAGCQNLWEVADLPLLKAGGRASPARLDGRDARPPLFVFASEAFSAVPARVAKPQELALQPGWPRNPGCAVPERSLKLKPAARRLPSFHGGRLAQLTRLDVIPNRCVRPEVLRDRVERRRAARLRSRPPNASANSLRGHHQHTFIGRDLARSKRFDMDAGRFQNMG